jgi:hypothetical protein
MTPKQKLTVLINSTAFFLIAYLVVYVLGQLIQLVSGLVFEYDLIWYYYKVQFNVNRGDWNFDSVKTIFSSHPLFLLLMGLIFAAIYNKVKTFEGILKQFFLWAYLISLSSFFIAVFIGGFFNLGFGHVLNWSFVQDTGRMLYAIIAITGLLSIGILSTRAVLISSNSYFDQMPQQFRFQFYKYQILLPYLIGMIIITLIRLPNIAYNSYYDLLTLTCMVTVVFFIRFRLNSINDLYFEVEGKKQTYSKKLLIALGILLVLYRVGLAFGIHFSEA